MEDIIAIFSRWAKSGLSQMFSRVSSSSDASASSSMEPIQHSVMGDFQRIMRMLPRIEAVLEDAEEREVVDRAVNFWLSELRDLAYDIDDVVDEYEYEMLRVQIETKAAEKASRYGKRKRSYDDHDDGDRRGEDRNILASSSSQVPAISDGMAQNLREIRKRFDEIESDRKVLRLREDDGVRRFVTPQKTRLTSSLVDESSVFGRKDDKEKIMKQLLLNPKSNNFTGYDKINVIPIVGMGGVGKTTLAQLIYNDPKICRYFDLRAWIHVSEDFDPMRLTRKIYESITNEACQGHVEYDSLQCSIRNELLKFNRKFFVLDDVWNEEQIPWESLQLPFNGAGIVNILMTTRSKMVADVMRTTESFFLDLLSIEEGCALFQKCALCDDDDTLMEIGCKIVEKCGRLPLAVKLLGSHLRFERDEDKWMSILKSNIWDLKPGKTEILPSLRLSYKMMPNHLKSCFKYLSMFPKNSIPDKNRLVWLWMAQGYIQPNAANKTMEELGGEYFDELLERSLLQPTESECYFKIHDLIFDLIIFISGEEFAKVKLADDRQNKIISNNIRRLVVDDQRTRFGAQKDIPAYPSLNKHLTLRSILYHGKSMFYDFQFSNSMQLRTLHLYFEKSDPTTLMLLGSIASLKHLRYLYIGMGSVDNPSHGNDVFSGIFNSFCRLYYLQVLDLSDYQRHFKLQASMNNLINLHHLILPLHSPITCGINKLTSLRTLKHVIYEEGSNECGELSEIEDLANLTGNCRISKLCNATNVESVKKANINKKRHLRRLCLNWSPRIPDGASFDVDISFHSKYPKEQRSKELAEAILEALRPHNSLKGFELYHYPGIRFPLWLGDPSYSKLQDLMLYRCDEWDGSCGVLDRGLPCLQEISIIDCAELKQLKIVQSSSLRCFLVEDCPKLSTVHGLCNLLKLEKLEIRKCYNLMISVEERLPSKLHSLCFEDCWKLTLTTGLQHLRSLKELKLQRCLKLQLSLDKQLSITPAVVMVTDCLGVMEWCQRHGFKYIQEVFKMDELTIRHNNDSELYHESGNVSLKALHICNYYVKDFIEDEWIPCTLNTLILRSCRRLRLLPPYQNLSTLRQLEIRDCFYLEYLQGLQLMGSLEKLEIINCGNLKLSLVQRLPSKLQYLLITNCPRLKWLPGLQQLQCLRDLKLHECCEIMLLPPEQLPFILQVRLEIIDCPKLGEWCRRYKLSYNNEECVFARSSQKIKEDSALSKNLCVLDYDEAILETQNWLAARLLGFYVCSCVYLKSITFGHNLESLRKLRIWNCSHLEELYGLFNLTSLEDIDISNCINLCFLCPPESLQSFQKPVSRERLLSSASSCFFKISKCPKLDLHDAFKQYINWADVVEIHACPQLRKLCQKYGCAYFQD